MHARYRKDLILSRNFAARHHASRFRALLSSRTTDGSISWVRPFAQAVILRNCALAARRLLARHWNESGAEEGIFSLQLFNIRKFAGCNPNGNLGFSAMA